MISDFAKYALVVAVAAFTFPISAAEMKEDAALKAAVADPARKAENTARDIYRHPTGSLSFWGLAPGMTVIEIDPASGYWTEILAPYATAGGGHYIAQMADEKDPKIPEAAKKNITTFKSRFSNEAKYGKVTWVDWRGEGKGLLGPAGSADMVISARNMHDYMWTKGELENVLKDMYAVLKPGGILAVEDHRADPRKQVEDAHDGYVNTDYMIAAVTKAGFTFEGKSEVNANPKDTKDYPLGVWTLPPTNARTKPGYLKEWPDRPEDSALREAAFYKAIGESDRMTLRFRKPR